MYLEVLTQRKLFKSEVTVYENNARVFRPIHQRQTRAGRPIVQRTRYDPQVEVMIHNIFSSGCGFSVAVA